MGVFSVILALLQIGIGAMTDESQRIEPGISRELARFRAAQITNVRYRLSLTIEPGASRLRGTEQIRFNLAKAGEQAVLDFRDLDENGKVVAGSINKLTINGTPVATPRMANGHIFLPADYVKAGENLVTLSFDSGIGAAGRPVIRAVDRDDGNEYVYTLVVPMDASLVFPCFDQPDIKGRFTLEVTAPREWAVIANSEPLRSTEGERPAYRTISFRETQPISTYLFAFAAGPFQQLDGRAAPVPLRLWVRKSRLADAQKEWDEVQDTTRRGLQHLTDYFAEPFPFSKYDQVLLPGFAYGGMEHAGATFLREDSILFRATPTKSDRLNRASLILHELTHQWFGDLVTMRWFDDLWLKEGFANYMASQSLAALNPADHIWKRFYHVHKTAAYAIDSTKGTTPIYQEVRNLLDAKSAYGAIVYQKAPSLLRALSFKIGETAFRNGVRLFLKEHRFANAAWSDLIKAFERASGQQLDGWAEAWIRQRGMPQIDVLWQCDSRGLVSQLALRQHDVLGESRRWPIRTKLLLAYSNGATEQLTVDLDSESTTVETGVNKKCPVYIFGNYEDQAYGRFLLDEKSRKGAISQLGKTADPFLRSLLLGALWDSVRESEMPPAEYLAVAINTLRGEKDEQLAQSLLTRSTTTFQRYLSLKQQEQFASTLEALCLDRMVKAPEAGLRINFFRAFRSLATTQNGRARLKDALAGKLPVEGMTVKPLDRWQIIRVLMGAGDPEAEDLLATEQRRDPSDEGRKQSYLAEAARGDARSKERYFDDYLKNRNVPEDWIEESLTGFNFWRQSALNGPYLGRALEALPQIKRERKIFFGLAWLNAFIGGQQSREALAVVEQYLQSAKIDEDLRLKVLEVTDELERTVRIRAKWSIS